MLCALVLTGCTVKKADDEPVAGEPSSTEEHNEPPATTNTPERVERPDPVPPDEFIPDDLNPDTVFDDNAIVYTARELIGIEFRSGGSSPGEGFDNSGFIHYVLRANGYVNSPRVLHEQTVMGNRIYSMSELLPGDLVFFSESGDRAQFGGIYTGGGIMISCRMQGETVDEFDITENYYINNFYVAVRVM